MSAGINFNRALGGTGNIALDDKLRNTNTFLNIGTVKSVNTVLGNVSVEIGKDIFDIRLNGLAQRSGSVDIYVPVNGDSVWVYRDATITTIIGYVTSDASWAMQDRDVSRNLEITQTSLLRPVEQGNLYSRSAQGSSLFLNGNVLLQDATGSSIEIDSNQDKIEMFSSTIEQNMLYSEIKGGLTKRYNPKLNPTYDSVIFDPNGGSTDPMSEFTVYLGKSLADEMGSTEDYLLGSDSDPNYKNVSTSEGKEDKPAVTFSLSDSAVVDINGETFPTLEGLKLNMLLEIAEDFAFKVNNQGSFLIGKANEEGISGMYLSNDDVAPFLSLGLNKGNQVVFRKDQSVSLENKKGFYKIMENGLLQFSAGSKVLVNMDPTDGAEKFEIILTTSPNMIFTASADGVSINAGGNILKLGGGSMQFNGNVDLGTPSVPSLSGKMYEGALLTDTFLIQLNILCASIASLTAALSTPILGLAVWPQVYAAAASTSGVLAAFIAQLTASSTVGKPFVSSQVRVAP